MGSDRQETFALYREPDTELEAKGVRGREKLPAKDLGVYTRVKRDPVKIVLEQNKGRLPHLIPLRHARMAASPFAFFRGAAGLMAFDLSHQKQTETQVVISGDAHINNFGLYASPERRLVFDLNDFDEAAPGPWEWDVKRLLTSAVLAAQENQVSKKKTAKIVREGAKTYRESLRTFAHMPALDRLYASVDSTTLAKNVREDGVKMLNKVTKKAWKRDADRTIQHLMGPNENGQTKFLEQPPILTDVSKEVEEHIGAALGKYQSSTSASIDYFLTQYRFTDVALRVVGVGSVGTRCYLVALSGPDEGGLILQAKEAGESVVTRYSKPNVTTPPTLAPGMTPGERVIVHQRILQAVSDPFLGYLKTPNHAFYVRQYRDAKGSFDTTAMTEQQLENYVELCAHLLARAHAQSPMVSWIAGYLGDEDDFDKAMVKWATAYAKQSCEDYEKFRQAIERGEVEAAESA